MPDTYQGESMKKSLQLLVIILLTAAVVPEAFAYNFVSGGIYYDITGSSPNTVAVTYATGAYNSYSGTVNIPNEVTYDGTTYTVTAIGNNAFRECSNLTGVSIPYTVTSIGEYAFSNCTGLASITSYNETPPVWDLSFTHPFNGVSRNTPVYVPCGSAQDYRNEWKYPTNNTSSYFYNIYENLLPYFFSVSSEDTLKGTVQIITMPSCTEPALIEATPKFFYNFDHWSDGNTDNPRTLTLTQDTALVAYFREYAVMVASNDTTAGVVYMTGLPTSENPLATVEAVLLDSCYVFAGWSDGSTDNPHTISVTQDTLLSATFNSVVNLQITAPTTVCRGDNSTLIATGADRYLWFNGDTSSIIKIQPDNSMEVTVTGTSNNGCFASKGYYMNVQSNPTLTFSGYTDICEGDSTIITAISSISINNILFENFADGVPSDWTIANNYLHTESLSGNHDKALVFPAYNLGHGFSDELIIPVQNLSIIQEPTLQFDVANSESVFYSGKESLSVFYSMDEGVTWNELYNKYGYSLATVSENTNQNFIPSDTQWRTETIDLTGVSGNVIIKFVFESDFYNYDHNNVWLDNIVLKPKINTQNVLLYEDFENPLSEEWGNIDTYGNGDAWLSSTHYSNDGIPAANRGEKCIVSVNQQYQCEHQLITPTITIPTSGASLSWYINGYISEYAVYFVKVVSNMQTTFLWFDALMNSGWEKRSVDLSAWAGEDIQIMFVHQRDYMVMLDDIMVLANDNYIWSDGSMSPQHSFSSSGTWQVTASDINGCHTTDSVTIAVWQPDTVEITINTPESFYVLNGEAFCQSGDYTQTLQNSHGCDSVVNLHLAIAPQDTVVINDTICGGYRDVLVKAPAWYLEEYYGITNPNLSDTVKVSFLYYYDENYNNIPIEIDQNYWDTHDYYLLPQVNAYTNTYGCDSIVVYNKYMTFSDWTMIWDTVCGSYNWNGTVLTNSGEYYEIETYTNARGCASYVNLLLTVIPVVNEVLSATACESFTLNDVTYTESGIYTQYTDTLMPIQRDAYYNEGGNYWYYFDNYGNFRYSESETYVDTVLGCKVITLNLTISHATASDTIATACNSFEWHGTIYTQSGDYFTTLTNAAGCDSIVTLHLTVNHSTVNDFFDTACDSYTWNDSVYSLSGDYTQTFTAANSCDSVVTLHLTINNSDQTELTAVACGEYVWLDSTYTTSGNYSKIYTNMADCDSIVTLHLTINPIPEVSITGNTTICPGGGTMLTATGADSYLWSNWTTGTSISVNMFGVYTVTGTTAAGCTNTASVTVLVAQPPVITITGDLEICAGDTGAITAHGGSTYMWSNGSTDSSITVSSTGSWQVIGYDENGCNSMASATVTVWQPASSQFSVTVNDSCYIWNTISYCESGNYTQTLQTVHGCDSLVTLHLTLTTTVYADVYETACNNYTWNNVTYNQSGDYTQTFSLEDGSDSVVTLHLTVNPTYAVNDTRTICASELPFIWNGVQFTEAATQSVTLQTINDCDSVVTMTLMVNQSATGIDVQEACDSFEWIDGVTYTESNTSATYTLINAVGCDSIVTLHLTINESATSEFTIVTNESCYVWNGIEYCETGDYTQTLQSEDGCDSVVTLHLTIGTGINNHYQNASLNVYPNPTTDIVNVELTINNGQSGDVAIQVYDMYGKLLDVVNVGNTDAMNRVPTDHSVDSYGVANTHGLSAQTTQIDLSSYANGVYFIKAVAEGNVLAVMKVVKNR